MEIKLIYDQLLRWRKDLDSETLAHFKRIESSLYKYNTVLLHDYSFSDAGTHSKEELREQAKGEFGANYTEALFIKYMENYHSVGPDRYRSKCGWTDLGVYFGDNTYACPTIDAWGNYHKLMSLELGWALEHYQKRNNMVKDSNGVSDYDVYKSHMSDVARNLLKPAFNEPYDFAIPADYLTAENVIVGMQEWMKIYFPKFAHFTKFVFMADALYDMYRAYDHQEDKRKLDAGLLIVEDGKAREVGDDPWEGLEVEFINEWAAASIEKYGVLDNNPINDIFNDKYMRSQEEFLALTETRNP